MIFAASEQGTPVHVFADETRPLLQGARLTAWELEQDGIPATLLTDSMAGWLMAEGRIDAVVVGADRIAANGDAANKIGTYSLSVLARAHGVPFIGFRGGSDGAGDPLMLPGFPFQFFFYKQIAADEGTSVRAVHDGTVAFAGPFTGFGNLVIIDHGSNTFTLYGQLGAMNVAQGVKVDRGEPLGTAGRMLVGIPGVYFEIRVDGKPVDPLEWLKKRP